MKGHEISPEGKRSSSSILDGSYSAEMALLDDGAALATVVGRALGTRHHMASDSSRSSARQLDHEEVLDEISQKLPASRTASRSVANMDVYAGWPASSSTSQRQGKVRDNGYGAGHGDAQAVRTIGTSRETFPQDHA